MSSYPETRRAADSVIQALLFRIQVCQHRSGKDARLEIHNQQHSRCLCIPVGGSTFLTNMKIAFSGETFILLRITYTNCPTVRSAGTKYLQLPAHPHQTTRRKTLDHPSIATLQLCKARGHGCRSRSSWYSYDLRATHFFLSMSGMSLFCAFSTTTYTTRADELYETPAGCPEMSFNMFGSATRESIAWEQRGVQAQHVPAPAMHTGILSGYLSRIRPASACRLSAKE